MTAKTAKFRHIGPGGFVAIGFSGFTHVDTDEVIEVPDDDEAVRPFDQVVWNGHEVHRKTSTTADCYRNQPALWEEIPDIKPAKAEETQ